MLRGLNRFLIAIMVGVALYLLVGGVALVARWPDLMAHRDSFLDSLATNFLSEATFFVLVGVAGVFAQFYGERGDVLQQRLRRLFANQTVSLPVIGFFEDVAKANSVYAELAQHRVTVLEFRPDLCAYRGEFSNSYRLRNAFGDIAYNAEIVVQVAPDLSREVIEPLTTVTVLRLTTKDGVQDFLGSTSVKVSRAGFQRPIRVTLPPTGEALLEMQWYSWIDASGDWDSGFSLKRFSERFAVEITNKSPVTVQIARAKGVALEKIEYGQTLPVSDQQNVAPRTRVEFYWHPPVGYELPNELVPGQSLTSLLEFDRRLGDTTLEKL